MDFMYVIYTLDTFARKSNVSVIADEGDAQKAILGLRANGLNVGYEKIEVWKQVNLIVK
ncbi:TPA: hypothetical protein QCV86_003014 [Bacillus thuringiensis]|uniref:Uncharacterized protein n=1 Tax=Bacillus phage vB_BtS_BMBtp3 TaxID=1445809 RepID=A0A0A7AR63_9CAUD|nr:MULTISPECIES: hypothetical protein [Bacillus cereus group]YP_009194038.1 hypothetical protein BMBtpLA_60 [Bacillus phage vB_BtS_BMBtp3]AHJ86769.1 hypothetical protein BMBtpLA_60 [Bacillus phage vB_BtS_BMBtp3]KLA37175.1 hypothetical protein B4158_5677 [Bacillus cereus]MBU0451096.1 hypothetical protein [Bacillus thuringiensis]MCC3982933.1 hypothetical protein [Bacillus thuringiensis serovar kurstaki]MCR6840988.1 hypothetical protein [Bacillus thuringiensis]